MNKVYNIIAVAILISSCTNSQHKETTSFYREEKIDNNVYLGFNIDGKCIPFKKNISSSGDTEYNTNYLEYYNITFPENNKQYCYIQTPCNVPLKLSIYDLIKYNDVLLKKSIELHVSKFSNYPLDQQLFIMELMKINDAIITGEERQSRLEKILNHNIEFVNWKFILTEKKIEALLGCASWIDFSCEEIKFRYFIHNTVSEAFDHTLGDDSLAKRIKIEEQKYSSFEVGKQYSLSGVINEDKYGFGIALGNPISINLK
jgi:hypothetical protein